MSQTNLNLAAKSAGPVECLGQRFPSEEARREHYLRLLAQKLKDPEFRKIDGFPIGKDEDILGLSDPPYYTACPNPWLADFVKGYGTPYDPKQPYHREPFAVDVGEGKYHPLYKLHPYPTKVPHRAIMKYILHYTQPGDLVFDGFCGTGMTGAAARLCADRAEVESLGYRVTKDGAFTTGEGQPPGKIGARIGVLADISPSATFISHAANNSVHGTAFDSIALDALKRVEAEHGWMFATLHGVSQSQTLRLSREIVRAKDSETCRDLVSRQRSEGMIGRVNYAVWSDVFTCPECGGEIVYWNSCVDKAAGKVLEVFDCPTCEAALTKRNLNRVNETVFDTSIGKPVTWAKQAMVRINYSVGSSRHEKEPDAFDLALIEAVARFPVKDWHPTTLIPEGDKTSEPIRIGVTHALQFFTKRNLTCLASFRSRAVDERALLFVLTKLAFQITKFYRFTYMNGVWGAGGGPLSGTLYIPSLNKELNVLKQMAGAIDDRSSVPESNEAPRALGLVFKMCWSE